MRYAHNAGEYIAPMDGAMPRGPNMRYAHSAGGYIVSTDGGMPQGHNMRYAHSAGVIYCADIWGDAA